MVAAQRSAILGPWFAPIPAMRGDQFDAARCELRAQRVAVIAAVANDTLRFLAGSSTATSVCYPDRSDRFFGEPGSPSFLKNSVSRPAGVPVSVGFSSLRLFPCAS